MALIVLRLPTARRGNSAHHPRIGRPLDAGLRELVISRGKTGYLALHEHDEAADLAIVLAVCHQREEDYHGLDCTGDVQK